jgi:hypothetical protein
MMDQEIAYYDRLPPSDGDKSYDYLMRRAHGAIERDRLHWHRNELSRAIGAAKTGAQSEARPSRSVQG